MARYTKAKHLLLTAESDLQTSVSILFLIAQYLSTKIISHISLTYYDLEMNEEMFKRAPPGS